MTILRARIAAVVGAAALWTMATVLVPGLRLSLFSPDLRIVLEVAGLCVALFAALALMVPGEDGKLDPFANASVVALLTLGVSNAVFGVLPILVNGDQATGGGWTFYPWLVARYTAGVLFILASLPHLQLRLRTYALLTVALLALADGAFLLLGDTLPVPLPRGVVDARAGMAVDVSTVAATAVVTAVPGVLFGIGAWTAWRAFLRNGQPIYQWLCLALCLQVLTQVHEVLYPALLGPVITTADAMGSSVLVVLLLGAVLQVRTVFLERAAKLRRQADDLRLRDELLAALRQFTEREQSFRAIVSHELSTPIATLRGFARLLAGAAPLSPDARQEALEGLLSESQRLQELVARMDELSRLELDEFHCELRPVLLCPLLEEAATALRGLPGSHPIKVSCPQVRVEADPVRLGQALRNLLANAAQYASAGTPIHLEAEPSADGHVQVAVADRGPGIPVEERERVLRKYERGSAGASGRGTGLGLYVAERIARAHGGRLFFDEGWTGLRAVLELRMAR